MPTIEISIEPLLAFADDPVSAGLFLLSHGGWIIPLLAFLWMAKILWLANVTISHVAKKLHPVLLAIDVPKLTVQTPKGVENLLAHLAGAQGSPNRREKWILGWAQEWFSLEIISIEGYIQFLIWTWDKYRDLVEAAIYAQYPDAQITEVQDYTLSTPLEYPNPEWELFGTEFSLVQPSPYPLKTWEEFEHKGQKDEPFKDPLAALLENLARVGPGEQIWMQILIMPMPQDWKRDGEKLVRKLIGAKVPAPKTALDAVMGAVSAVTSPVLTEIMGATEAKPKKDEPLTKMLHLSPGERTTIEGVERKLAKIGFRTKIRTIYVAKKDAFKKPRGFQALMGAMKQFSSNTSNSFKPDLKKVGPGSQFWFKEYRNNARRRKLMRAYRGRSMWIGLPAYILNTEELATIWHFPTVAVHSPLIRRTEAKRAEPPPSLPIAHAAPPPSLTATGELPRVAPPEGLPIIEDDAGQGVPL